MNKLFLFTLLFLTSCEPYQLSLRDMAFIAGKDLSFTHYPIRYAEQSEVEQMCSDRMPPLAGCTNDEITLISNKLTGCMRIVTVFHELWHQYQFTVDIPRGEDEAEAYSIKMGKLYCEKE